MDKLSQELGKQLDQIREKLATNRDEKKQLLRLQKTLNSSLRLMDSSGGAIKRPKVRRSKRIPPATS